MLARAAKASGAPCAQGELLHDIELRLHHRHDDQLRHAFHGHERERDLTAIPQRNKYLSLVIRIYQSHQIAQHDAVLVSQA